MKLINIVEARSNPAQNPKQNVFNELSKYAGRKDIFVTFSNVNKMGIFPSSTHETPTGFYAYPISNIWDKLQHKPLSQAREFPTQLFSKYVLITQLIDNTGIYDVTDTLDTHTLDKIKNNELFKNNTTLVRFSHPTYSNLYQLMYHLIAQRREQKYTQPEYDEENDDFIDNFNHDATGQIGQEAVAVLRQLGINGITDLTGTGTIHNCEPTQAVFFNMRNLKHIDTLLDKDDNDPKNDIFKGIQNMRPNEIINMSKFIDNSDYHITTKQFDQLTQWFKLNFVKYCFDYPELVKPVLSTHSAWSQYALDKSKLESIRNLNDAQLTTFLTKCANSDNYHYFIDILGEIDPKDIPGTLQSIRLPKSRRLESIR